MWTASQRFIDHEFKDERIILHLGDHDPSGIDMTRDIQERLNLFGADVEVKRIALTMEQISKFNPPPNPAKITDSRCGNYIKKYGNESWELDALEPNVITELIKGHVYQYLDTDLFKDAYRQENEDKEELQMLCNNYYRAIGLLQQDDEEE